MPITAHQAKPSFFNPRVAQFGAYIVQQHEEFQFTVLGPNADAGKPDVSYSGKLLTVCTTDGAEDATRIARALDLLAQQEAA